MEGCEAQKTVVSGQKSLIDPPASRKTTSLRPFGSIAWKASGRPDSLALLHTGSLAKGRLWN